LRQRDAQAHEPIISELTETKYMQCCRQQGAQAKITNLRLLSFIARTIGLTYEYNGSFC